MDFTTAESAINEASKEGPLLIYVAIGCALDRYLPGEHPPQQYPPFLKNYLCSQICVLIDPYLEMPPRAIADTSGLRNVTILPIQSNLDFNVEKTPPSNDFLQNLVDLCMNTTLQVKLIVHDFSGRDINEFYPVHYGERAFQNVLFDFTYEDGGCFPDLQSVTIFEKDGKFLQPKYMRLKELQGQVPKDIFIKEYKSRRYPLQLFAVIHRVHRKLEEPRDWITEQVLSKAMKRFHAIYNPQISYDSPTRNILIHVTKDFCNILETDLTQFEIETIVDNSTVDNMWKLLDSILCSE